MDSLNAGKPNPSIPEIQAGAMATGRTVRERRPTDADAPGTLPGLVIPGESSQQDEFPESGESYEFLARGKRLEVIAHPLPHPEVRGCTAITDYLNCTFPFVVSQENIREFFSGFLPLVGKSVSHAKHRGCGFNGYQDSYKIVNAGGACFGCGGQAGTALLSLPGKACALINDWLPVVEFLRDRYGARITRWDGAVDDFEGTHPVDWAVERYKAGDFTNGGNKPSSGLAGSWIDPDGSGRTLYIGKRKNGKMLRVYEKGMQLGHQWHPWVRYEVELHNVDRVVPWEVLLDPGKYVAGAYPKALGWVAEEMSRIRTLQTQGPLSYEHLVRCASNAYGPLVNIMLEVEGSPEEVVKRLRKPGAPARPRFPDMPTWWK